MSTQVYQLLMIGRNSDDMWLDHFQSYLAGFCLMEIVQKATAFDRLRHTIYDIVILDDILLISNYNLIDEILKMQPSTRVVVVTDATDWRRARLAFQHGAADYLPASIKDEDLKKAIQEVINPVAHKGDA